ncbi:MAG: amidohydrolase family protein [Bryobacteraceae bacterium]
MTRLALFALAAIPLAAQPLADHHMHLLHLGPAPPGYPSTAEETIRQMDAVGVRWGVLLSAAYQFGNPFRPPVENEYERVKAENDWTAEQAGKYPKRLTAFCGVNPLKEYALREIARCGQDPRFGKGLKLHFGNSDVSMDQPAHVERLRAVFAAASRHRMAIVAHIRSNYDHRRPWGAEQARVFLEQVVPAAKGAVVQIAHAASAGHYDDEGVEQALGVFADAVAKRDPRMKQVYFDLSILRWEPKREALAKQLRMIGMKRLLFASDQPVATAWKLFRGLPLTERELRRIERNVAPYLRRRG